MYVLDEFKSHLATIKMIAVLFSEFKSVFCQIFKVLRLFVDESAQTFLGVFQLRLILLLLNSPFACPSPS